MSDIKIAGHMARKSVTRDLSGNIINWIDESDGGWIIRNRVIVNQQKIDEMARKEEDRKIAARAIAEQKTGDTPDRTVAPAIARAETAKLDALEKRIDAQDSKLDAILAALKK